MDCGTAWRRLRLAIGLKAVFGGFRPDYGRESVASIFVVAAVLQFSGRP